MTCPPCDGFSPLEPELRAPVRAPRASRGKVLVMDDEEMVRMVVGEMLLASGYLVDFARDGEEAIALYAEAKMSEAPFSVVIMDLTVPGGMGGKEAIEKLREIDSGVVAVVSSGYSDDPVMANFREHGFHAVIAKPYRVNDLQRTLQSLDFRP